MKMNKNENEKNKKTIKTLGDSRPPPKQLISLNFDNFPCPAVVKNPLSFLNFWIQKLMPISTKIEWHCYR